MFLLKPALSTSTRGRSWKAANPRHSVVFTVTGLTKVVGGVPTVCRVDRDS
jgi:hypothetical protein